MLLERLGGVAGRRPYGKCRFKSLQDNNQANFPSSSPTYWTQVWPEDPPVTAGGAGESGNDWDDFGQKKDVDARDVDGNYVTWTLAIQIGVNNPDHDITKNCDSSNNPVAYFVMRDDYEENGAIAVEISDTTGSGARARARVGVYSNGTVNRPDLVAGRVTHVEIVAAGENYSENATATITGGGGVDAALDVTLYLGTIGSISPSDQGSGYSGLPLVADGNDFWDTAYGLTKIEDCTTVRNCFARAYDAYVTGAKGQAWVNPDYVDPYIDELAPAVSEDDVDNTDW